MHGEVDAARSDTMTTRYNANLHDQIGRTPYLVIATFRWRADDSRSELNPGLGQIFVGRGGHEGARPGCLGWLVPQIPYAANPCSQSDPP